MNNKYDLYDEAFTKVVGRVEMNENGVEEFEAFLCPEYEVMGLNGEEIAGDFSLEAMEQDGELVFRMSY